jgi:hypothetical protein
VELGVVLDAHRAHVDETPNAGLPHPGDDGTRPLGVDQAQVGASVEVARDRREVDHGVDPDHGGGQRVGPGHVADPNRDAVPILRPDPADDDLARRIRPAQRDDAVTVREEGRNEVAADEAAGAGHEDGRHGGGIVASGS